MAIRTSDVLVKALLAPGRDYDSQSNPDISPFILSANVLVNRLVIYGQTRPTPIEVTTDEAEIIERWLSAHFYKQSDKGFASKTTGNASATFEGKTGMALDSTRYGQHAKLLDPTGYLLSIEDAEDGAGGRPVAGGFWAGTSPQRGYEGRTY